MGDAEPLGLGPQPDPADLCKCINMRLPDIRVRFSPEPLGGQLLRDMPPVFERRVDGRASCFLDAHESLCDDKMHVRADEAEQRAKRRLGVLVACVRRVATGLRDDAGAKPDQIDTNILPRSSDNRPPRDSSGCSKASCLQVGCGIQSKPGCGTALLDASRRCVPFAEQSSKARSDDKANRIVCMTRVTGCGKQSCRCSSRHRRLQVALGFGRRPGIADANVREWRRIVAPTSANPAVSISQDVGSGTAAGMAVTRDETQ